MTIKLKPFKQIILEVKEFYKDFKVDGGYHSEKFANCLSKITEDFFTFNELSYVLVNFHGSIPASLNERIEFNELSYAMAQSHYFKNKNNKFKQSNEIVISKDDCNPDTVIVWCDDIMVVKYSESGRLYTETVEGDIFYSEFWSGIDDTPHFIIGTL